MDIKKLIQLTEIQRAPVGFTDKMMLKIEAEKQYSRQPGNYELLSLKQKAIMIAASIFLLCGILFIPAQEISSSNLINKFIYEVIDNFETKIQSVDYDFNILLILTGAAFISICYFTLDMIIKKSFSLSLK
jgi:hypothetical protein